jgi:hypothetical protein
VVDPPLFSRSDSQEGLPADVPLFDDSEQVESLVEKRIAASVDPASTPAKEDYLLFVSCVMQNYKQNPAAYLARQREYARMPGRRVASGIRKPTNTTKFQAIAPAPKSPAGHVRLHRAPREPRTPKSVTPRVRVHDSFAVDGSPRQRAQTGREDADFNALPDYSPPISTLTNPKCLKADWKGQMLDLSDDPHVGLLHPAEVYLAGTLRLSAATYLCSKRRIFQARLDAFRRGKDFRKTDSQQACKIDVNKASKLWSAYDRIGWFDPMYIKKFL